MRKLRLRLFKQLKVAWLSHSRIGIHIQGALTQRTLLLPLCKFMAEVQLSGHPYPLADNTNKSSSTKPRLLLWNCKHHSGKLPTARAHEMMYICSPCPALQCLPIKSFLWAWGMAEWLLTVEFPHCSAKDKPP